MAGLRRTTWVYPPGPTGDPTFERGGYGKTAERLRADEVDDTRQIT